VIHAKHTQPIKTLLYILLLSLSITLCYGQKLKITINNKTGFDVDTLLIRNKDFGYLKKDTTFSLINFNCLYTQSGGPLECDTYKAIINTKKYPCEWNGPFNYCGTGIERIDEGAL
jgi:hypothetical protein